jgi:hypothetical protein
MVEGIEGPFTGMEVQFWGMAKSLDFQEVYNNLLAEFHDTGEFTENALLHRY